MVPRNRLEGEGFKPPTAAGVKSPGGERVGKRRGLRLRQVSIKEMNENEPLMRCRNALHCCQNQGTEAVLG